MRLSPSRSLQSRSMRSHRSVNIDWLNDEPPMVLPSDRFAISYNAAVLFDLEDALDLDRDPERERSHADCRAGVRPALRPEDLDEQVRGAVRHRRLLRELGVGVDEDEQLHDAAHAVELADLGLQAREQVDDRQARGGLSGRHVDLATELPLVDELPVLVRAVPRDEDDVADDDRADVGADGGV